jgi:GNAT superfamily N-acetyltransferase
MHYPVWRDAYSGGIIPDDKFFHFGDSEQWAENAVGEYQRLVSPDEWALWVGELDGEPVGMSIFGPITSSADRVELDSLYIAKNYQRSGIGSLLFYVVRASYPAAVVVAWCAEKNHKVRNFYTRHGFQLDVATDTWQPIDGVEVPLVCYTFDPSVI